MMSRKNVASKEEGYSLEMPDRILESYLFLIMNHCTCTNILITRRPERPTGDEGSDDDRGSTAA
jgi:hypothetical protein